MTNIRIGALVASLAMAIPVFAQYNSPTQTADNHMAWQTLNDPNVHWTIKEQNALLVEAPYVRPSDMWELNHMFHNMSGNDERVIFTALTNTVRANAGDYYTRRSAEEAYWQNMYNNPANVTTTVTTTPSGSTAVTTTTTTTPTTTVVTTPPPVITTPSTTYTPSTNAVDNSRQQSMVGAGNAVYNTMGEVAAWELMQRDLNAQDRTTFRMLWDGMTSGQQQAMVDIARQSNYYFTTRSRGVYYNPY
jgi:hypothetical protein